MSNQINPKLRLNKGFIIQKLDDNLSIFDAEKSVLYTFNQTAAFIFQKLKKGGDLESIKSAMVKKYKISQAQAAKDLNSLFKDLKTKKIII